MTTGRINQVELDNNKRPVGVAIVRVCVLAGGRGGARGTQHAAARARLLARSLLRLALLGFSQDRSAHSRRDRERGRTDAGWLLSSSALLSKGAPHAGVGENKRRRARTTAAAGSHPGASPSSSLSLFAIVFRPQRGGERRETGGEGRRGGRRTRTAGTAPRVPADTAAAPAARRSSSVLPPSIAC